MNFLNVKIIGPIVVILLSLIVYNTFKIVTKTMITKKLIIGDERKVKTLIMLINNVLKVLLIILDIVVILAIYEIDTMALITSLGAVSVVAGLAFQDVLQDFFSGIFILTENQYKVGDVITVGGFKGEVISLGMKSTKIRSFNGEVKILSNRFITEVINHSLEDSLAIVDISVDYNADTVLVEKVLNKVCSDLNKKIDNITDKIEVLGIESLGDNGVLYRIVVPCPPMMQFQVQREIRRELKIALEANKIDIPYSQVVIHNAK